MTSLDARMRNVLARLETLSYGTTQAWDKTGTRGKATGGDRPPGDAHPSHDTWRQLYNACVTDTQREKLLEDAETELRSFTHGSAPAEPGNLQWKRKIANSDEPLEHVLRIYSISRATYYRYRAQFREKV